ncbi:nitrate- and nitrite sensing domain-containing protein [Marinomonas sp. C2222]|uniref:Nitrate- and nitrite sensing domain-containing protein n=1 Tax=Marinomonas sargassi TaxID=2984494 RepID=A0ABT2YR89_9GAMM|nr:nitrate- and nitrite sensing domain-containing protein [Marinomonas sargassi]MCV2402376.1 nitrate- and nitrite sensing domain-containing protein [Marinomonas sargassi]
MMLTSVFFLVCFMILALAVGRQIWSQRIARERSIRGISGTKLLIELIKLTQQHRGMHSGYLNGKSEFKEKLLPLAKKVETYYNDILTFEKKNDYPESLSIHYLLKQWQRLLNNKQIQSSESFQIHSGLIARQLDAVWDLADEFSLTSNQKEDIRNVAQQLVKTLPELAESLGQVRALSVQVASKQEMSSDKKLQLLFTLGKIESHHKNLVTPLPSATNNELTRFVAKVKQDIKTAELTEQNPDILFQEATKVIDDIFVFINSGFDDLNGKFENS